MTELNQATVLITGASGGFGQQFTRQLLKAGSHLILTDLDAEKLEEQVAALETEIKTGKVIACWGIDLSTENGCQTLYDRAQELNLPIDILINNAGIAIYGRMDEVPSQKWETLMQINLLTPMRLSSLFIADMIARKQGHIVNISSLAGHIAPAGLAHYAASKFGLRGFTEGLFNEVKRYNIKVTGVYPFFSRTPLLQAERYGTLAYEITRVADETATDPEQVIAKVIQGIKNNQLHIFPDRRAKVFSLLKQYIPSLVNWRLNQVKPKNE
ncbi:SDR family NAD(P)-dependent oxidoreductase [Euhalothece natronophila Z-M001]|uniref:SDR family NAD(P)-dependent oxidoreductase n=1 Tax=Euhalothece natronophila Z-M001 TaxID=522448 RepID=A0A5B8NM34_9CHRO|nr:SDR family NAD(P)-dependent oxidoreductase [Euhalothece natronophila]QDZ40383.1 SDR family NAD(P)-dependent oxidoreductase [Euhalothece natronophila Z-M001]